MNNKLIFWGSVLVFLLCSDQALASSTTGEGYLPYESWLLKLRNSLTGPVAFSVSIIGIVSCGATLIFAGGEVSRFMRSILYMVMVLTFLIGANSLITNFFEGAVVAVDDAEIVDYIEEAYRRFEDKEDEEVRTDLYMHNELIRATV